MLNDVKGEEIDDTPFSSDSETREKLSAIAALIPEAGTVQKDNAVENQ